MTRFIHTADWQIGKPYRQIADEQKRFKLQQERLNAIGRIRDTARTQNAAFVLVAGDLFDSPTPPATAVLEVLEAIGEMKIPVLVIPGNHDHGALGTVWHREDFQRHQPEMASNLQLLLERKPVELDQAVLLPCPLCPFCSLEFIMSYVACSHLFLKSLNGDLRHFPVGSATTGSGKCLKH